MIGDMQPFRMAGNLYFVGTRAASSHLIDTGDGLILIDTGYPETADVIVESVAALGFDIHDVKLILHSHGHRDHTGGTAKLLGLCRAETWLRREDEKYISGFTPDHSYGDTESIRLGDTEIRCVWTPGHTVGTMSFFFDVVENGRAVRCGMFGGASPNQLRKSWLDDYGCSFDQRRQFYASIESLKSERVELHVGNHTWDNDYAGNFARMTETGENPFLDDSHWMKFLEERRKKMDRIIEEESRTTFVNFAHRGASEYCPENTLLSFYTGIYMGANGIETDVQRTADGKLVLFHDKTLERVTGDPRTVAECTWEQLQQLRVTKNGLEDRIVAFEDFLDHFAFRPITFAIELKTSGVGKEVAELVRRYGLEKRATITSFAFDCLTEVRDYAPELRCGYLTGAIDDAVIAMCREAGVDELCPSVKIITREAVDAWHRAGFRVRAWGLKTEDDMRTVVEAGADGTTCNFPDKLAALLRERAAAAEA